ncbi:fimbrial protein [Klebsiella aerogenes]
MMKLPILSCIAVLTMGTASLAYADCTQPSTTTAPALIVDMTDALELTTTASWSLKTQYPGSFSCSARPLLHRNSVGNSTPFSKNTVTYGFNNGQDFIKVNINNVNPSGDIKLNDTAGTYPASTVNAQFTLDVVRLPSNPGGKGIQIISGDTVQLNPAVIAMDTTNFSLIQAVTRFIVDFATFILTWHWPSHAEDIYYQPINLIFKHRQTTCEFSNAGLTVNLPQVDRASLINGVDKGETPFKLNFTCKYIEKGLATRSVKIYLSSNNLLANDNQTMVDINTPPINGVGIRVKQAGATQPVTFSTSPTSSSGATLLLDKANADAMDANFSLNLSAYYYVYDAKSLAAGVINTTSVLNFEYD